MDLISRGYIYGKIRLQHFMEGFREDESGVSAIIATVLLIVIVVALVAVFWSSISQWFANLWKKIFQDSENIGEGLNSPTPTPF
ncbi:MAG: hypothetical protein K6E62_02895 [Lachnospiraceae bacterium]|nr:hypothetical protein [Lachnospiraceae bacterium]